MLQVLKSRAPGNSTCLVIGLYAVLFLTTIAYWPGLSGGFLLDDYENLRPLDDLDRGVLSWSDAIFTTNSGPLARPVAMLSFVGNMVFSGPDVWAFKYTNLMIHLLCGVLIFWLSERLLISFRPVYSSTRLWLLASCVAALWLLAPLLVSTTLYLVQRMTQLAALFSLCGLIAYTHGRQRLDTHPLSGWMLILSSLLLWMPLAGFSKENGFLLPLLLFVTEVFVFRFAGPIHIRRGLFLFFFISLALPTLFVLATLVVSPNYLLGSYVGRPFSLLERVMTEARILFFYVWNLILPQGYGMGLFHDDFVISKGLLTPATTLLAITGWIFVLVLIFIARDRAWWPLLFGICFFLSAHSLESTIFPLELVFEHRNYLPAFGIFFSLVLGLALLMEKLPHPKPVVTLMVLLPLVYGFATYQRADTWSSWDKILLSAESAHPQSPRVHIELASLYSTAKNLEAALAELDHAQALRETTVSGIALHRIIVYCETERPIPPTVYENMPPRMATDDAATYTINTLRGINRLVYGGKCRQLDINRLVPKLEAWISNAPKNNYEGRLWDIHYEIAQLLQYTGRISQAIKHLEQASKLDPARPQALLVMMRYQLALNHLQEARQTLMELRIKFDHPTAEQARIIANYNSVIKAIDDTSKEIRP